MGLYLDRFRYAAGLPNLDEVRAEVHRRLGFSDGIVGLRIEGQTVEATAMLEPFPRAIVCAILQELGGQRVDAHGQPIDALVPAWAHKPIREMPWRTRMAVRFGWWAWFWGSAFPRKK